MKDAVATMGNVLPDDAGGRDAVHVAVFSAICPMQLFPSQHLSVVDPEPNPKGDIVVSGAEGSGPRIGIVDPFLSAPVPPHTRFWAYLYPRTITALAHRWSHPSFEATNSTYATPGSKAASEAWLKDFVAHADCPSYHQTLALAEAFLMGNREDGGDEYLLVDGQDAHGSIPDEFWDHAATVLGVQRPVKCPEYFSCSC